MNKTDSNLKYAFDFHYPRCRKFFLSQIKRRPFWLWLWKQAIYDTWYNIASLDNVKNKGRKP